MSYSTVLEKFFDESLFIKSIAYQGGLENDAYEAGILLDQMIEMMSESLPKIMVAPEPGDLFPLIIDHDETLHPVFCDQDLPDMSAMRHGCSYSAKRVPIAHYTEDQYIIDVLVFDRSLNEPIANLVYRDVEYNPSFWELTRGIRLTTSKIPEFISLARRIQHSKLEDIFDNSPPTETP